jgi:hypothetical protein
MQLVYRYGAVLARPDVMFVNNIDTRQLLQCDMPNNAWWGCSS